MTERFLKTPRINVRDRARAFEAKQSDGPKPLIKKTPAVAPPSSGAVSTKSAEQTVAIPDSTSKEEPIATQKSSQDGSVGQKSEAKQDTVILGKSSDRQDGIAKSPIVKRDAKSKIKDASVGRGIIDSDVTTKSDVAKNFKAKADDVQVTTVQVSDSSKTNRTAARTAGNGDVTNSSKSKVESKECGPLNVTNSNRKGNEVSREASQTVAGNAASAGECDHIKNAKLEVERKTVEGAVTSAVSEATLPEVKKTKKVKSSKSKTRAKEDAGVVPDNPLVYEPQTAENGAGTEPEHGGCIPLHNTEELVKQFSRMVAPPGGVLHAKSTSLDSGLAEITNCIDVDSSFGRTRRPHKAEPSSPEKRSATYFKYLQAITKGLPSSKTAEKPGGRRGSEPATEFTEDRHGAMFKDGAHALERSSSNSQIWEQNSGLAWSSPDSGQGSPKHQNEQTTCMKVPQGPKSSSGHGTTVRGQNNTTGSGPASDWNSVGAVLVSGVMSSSGGLKLAEQVKTLERKSDVCQDRRPEPDLSSAFHGRPLDGRPEPGKQYQVLEQLHYGEDLRSGPGWTRSGSLDQGRYPTSPDPEAGHPRQSGTQLNPSSGRIAVPEPNPDGRTQNLLREEPGAHAPAVAKLKAGQDARVILGIGVGPPSPTAPPRCSENERLPSGGADRAAAEDRLRHYYGEDGGLEHTSQIAQLLTSVQKIREEFERCAWDEQEDPSTGRWRNSEEEEEQEEEDEVGGSIGGDVVVVIGRSKFQDGENLATNAVAVAKKESRACGEQRERGKNSCGSADAAAPSLTRQNRSRRNRPADVSVKAELASAAADRGWGVTTEEQHRNRDGDATAHHHPWRLAPDVGAAGYGCDKDNGRALRPDRNSEAWPAGNLCYGKEGASDHPLSDRSSASERRNRVDSRSAVSHHDDDVQHYGKLRSGNGRLVAPGDRSAVFGDAFVNRAVVDTVNKVSGGGSRIPRLVPETGSNEHHQVSPSARGQLLKEYAALNCRPNASDRTTVPVPSLGSCVRGRDQERGSIGERSRPNVYYDVGQSDARIGGVTNWEENNDDPTVEDYRSAAWDWTTKSIADADDAFLDERPLHLADDGRMERRLCSLSPGDRSSSNTTSRNLARSYGPLTSPLQTLHPLPSPTTRASLWSSGGGGGGGGGATVQSTAPSPTCISKVPVRSKPSLPAYFTARQRPALDRFESDPERHYVSSDDGGERAKRDAIDTILGELDFGKFRRGAASNSRTVLRSTSHQGAPEKTHQDKLRELRELTEKLKPAIRRAKLESDSAPSAIPVTPPGGAAAYSQRELGGSLRRDDDAVRRFDQGRFRRPVFRSASVPQVDDLGADDDPPHLWNAADPPSRYDGATSSFPVSPFATLPRRREPYRNQTSVTDGLVSWAPLNNDNDPVTDEGLVADSDLAACNYAQEYRNVTSSVSAPATPGARHRTFGDVPSSTGFDFQVKAALAELRGTTAALQYSSLDRRKRRKGVGFDVGNGGGYEAAPSKTGNGRSLTYPPQRRSSVTEGMEYTSVDSNGLRSYGAAVPSDHGVDKGLAHPSRDRLDYPSELSLADSHLSAGDAHYNATYGDVLKSVTADADDGTGSGGNNKMLKKKHYSDPSGEKNGEGLLDLPEFMSCSKSEPRLPSDGGATGPSSLTIPYDRSGGALRAAVSSPVAFNHLDRTPSFGSSEGVTTPTTPLLERRDSKSPQQQRRYSKKRLRGPYGEMLEEEMRKSGEKQMMQQKSSIAEELSFLNDLMEPKTAPPGDGSDCPTSPIPTSFHMSCRSLDETALRVASERSRGSSNNNNGGYRRKVSANLPLAIGGDDMDESPPLYPASSVPSFLSGATKEQPWNLREELDAEGEDLESLFKRHQDTRTHVVAELYDTEKSYVESLQILVNKYFRPLKSPEYCTLVDATLVDEMFFQVPEILAHHETFLDRLKQRLENWDNKQKVGDVFGESFTKQQVIDTYTAFINNWKAAKEAIKVAMQAKPAFTKFLEHMSREHKGKLTLDDLLIMPVQRIPRYELLIKELLKHTQVDHPDHRLLLIAQKEVHDLAIKINHMEREAYEAEQMQLKLREMESMIEGLVDLVHPLRMFLRYDLVTMSGSLGTKKERCLFLFSDLLIITSIKRKSGTIRRTASSLSSPGSLSNLLEMNKYKLLMRISLDDLDVARTNDAHIKKALKDIGQLEEDATILSRMTELAATLNVPHQNLDELLKELLTTVSKQLQEKQTSDGQLLCLELTVTTQVGMETMSIHFSAPDKRSSWEAAFHEAKQKLALSTDRRPPPEFMYPLPIRKTRAGLQFTCAAPTLGVSAPHRQLRDVWVCNSDGYVGQVCVLSLEPEPTVASCNGVCNARILCIASIPPSTGTSASGIMTEGLAAHRRSTYMDSKAGVSIAIEDVDEEEEENGTLTSANGNIQLDSDSSEEEKEPSSECQDEENVQRKGETSPEFADDVRMDDMDNHQPTMWLGTEDGCIHVYNCNDNIRIKKNKVKLQHPAAIHCITHFDGKVFVALANGDLAIYHRDSSGGWDTNEPTTVSVGNSVTPIVRMIAVTDKLWCGCQNVIKVIDIASLEIENSFTVNPDANRPVQCMVTLGLGVWVSVQNSAIIKLYHATSYEMVLEVNVAPAVAKMLAAGCDDIIRQHKAACLRVTSLLACKDLLWIGTSAGVVLNLALPHLTSTTTKLANVPNVSGIPHGHTGHVRFLTCVEMTPPQDASGRSKYTHRSIKYKDGHAVGRRASTSALGSNRLLVISGGDGYEDFRNTNYSEAAGRDDSTNHLLLWQV